MKLIQVEKTDAIHFEDVISLEILKDFMRWSQSDNSLDVVMSQAIDGVIGRFDGPNGRLGRALLTQSWRLVLDAFTPEIRIPLPPVQSVTAITYVDAAGATQTLAPEAYRLAGETIKPVTRWPSTAAVLDAVSITFVAGYATGAEVPQDLRALLIAVAADTVDHTRFAEAQVDEVTARHREWAF